MCNGLSEQGRAERDAVIAVIHAAFAGVTRGTRGISWSETVAIDNYESAEVCEAARQSDADFHWSELVDDPNWHPFPGLGGFSFINAEGFRYYLPPTMIRCLRGDNQEWFPGDLLRMIERFTEMHLLALWSEEQLRGIARFIAFMARHDNCADLDPDWAKPWAAAIERRWSAYL